MRTPRIHDIQAIKNEVKRHAAEVRDLRNQARAVSGVERYILKGEARRLGSDQGRYALLAYGYLRGLKIEQMESPSTHPLRLADSAYICSMARDYFQKGPDAEAWEEEVLTETRVETPVPDTRGFFAKLVGQPAPGPKVTVKKKVDYHDPPGWDEFTAQVEADIEAWNKTCLLNHATKLALRRQRKAEAAVSAEAI